MRLSYLLHSSVLVAVATASNEKPSSQTLDAGFWYGSFDVGRSKNLSLLIDSGSSDVSINPDLYQPSHASVDLEITGTLGYSTVLENGCGVANVSYREYADTVSFAGLTAQNQTFAAVIAKPPPNNGTITQFPHQGIVGFSSTRANATQLGAVPFFQTLCDDRSVKECRLGLALGTEGDGTQVLGGIDHELFDGSMVEVDAAPNEEWSFNGAVTVDDHRPNLRCSLPLFHKLGIQAVEQNLPGCTTVLFGYYPCASPPQVGFSLGNSTRSFNIEVSAFEQANDGKGNCTAILTGIDLDPEHSLWIIGQAWFQGKYIDFDQTGGRVGVATLMT
ncbi:hypothetical protein LTR62_006297 [Meristemomyces frigidus]|uniref:Peptidase A1 domain-containing protein n=1 Tax=Meristemomyces frigidus TaxID=1508187 RepID=A0AAN7YEL7_9PEZI|nr:hypothetical protein LTR62_006297 [Meristemomyces frigidus]